MSKLKASDLRIGNYLNFSNGIEPDKIVKIGCRFFSQASIEPRLEDFLVTPYYQPIPLTSEILLACGFEEVEYESDEFYSIEYHLVLNDDIFISYSDDFSCGVWSNKSRMDEFGVIPNWEMVKYLHGLQNLVHVLSGQELEFKTELIK